jgi:RND family efflux transporter MFP subunit
MTGSSGIAAIAFLGVTLAAGAVYYWPKLTQKPRDAAAKPSIVQAESRNVSATVTATGTIRLRTGAEVRVGAQISGIVTKLNVTVGSHIDKDAVIAEIESRGLDARIAQARSQIEVDQASVAKLERELSRSRKLLEERLIPRQQTEDLEDDLKSSQARLDKSRSDLTVVESDLPYLTIRSPISGTVASVSTEQGETVAASFNAPTFVTIIEDNALELVAMVDETDIANIRPSNAVTFSTETYPSREFHGMVERIAPRATVVSGVVNYEVGIRIRSGLVELKPDMTANVSIETAQRRALMIPAEAIRKDGEQRFVYVASAGVAQKKEVAVGQRTGAWMEIKKGLDAGDGVYLRDLPAAGDKK